MADIFLSYCSADRDKARKLMDSLTTEGLSVWWDDRLTPVEQWDRLIEKEIHAASAVLVLWTPRAIESDWVRIEANFGRDKKKLLQARLENCEVPLQFTLLQWADLDNWFAKDDTANIARLIAWFRALSQAQAPAAQSALTTPKTAVPDAPSAPGSQEFADALVELGREAAESGSGRFEDVVIPGLSERWPTFLDDDRLDFRVVERSLIRSTEGRVKLVDAGLHLSLYFMRVRDESRSFLSLGMAMKAMNAAAANELAGFLPALRSLGRIAIENLEPNDIGQYALGRMLGAAAKHICAHAPDSIKQEWLAATSITLSAYGQSSKSLASGFREMCGDAGYSVEIVNFDVAEVAASFASTLLAGETSASFSNSARKRFESLKDPQGKQSAKSR